MKSDRLRHRGAGGHHHRRHLHRRHRALVAVDAADGAAIGLHSVHANSVILHLPFCLLQSVVLLGEPPSHRNGAVAVLRNASRGHLRLLLVVELFHLAGRRPPSHRSCRYWRCTLSSPASTTTAQAGTSASDTLCCSHPASVREVSRCNIYLRAFQGGRGEKKASGLLRRGIYARGPKACRANRSWELSTDSRLLARGMPCSSGHFLIATSPTEGCPDGVRSRAFRFDDMKISRNRQNGRRHLDTRTGRVVIDSRNDGHALSKAVNAKERQSMRQPHSSITVS